MRDNAKALQFNTGHEAYLTPDSPPPLPRQFDRRNAWSASPELSVSVTPVLRPFREAFAFTKRQLTNWPLRNPLAGCGVPTPVLLTNQSRIRPSTPMNKLRISYDLVFRNMDDMCEQEL
ncbi:hypothetical protein BDV95DRAFT_360984 [Massariosphaeria phaeospora]|uniref:Uncharacterized protein n=1 Tax=Massariosphaeria phaeospora TaxID=100035 RepID=A0A7C8MMQ0_9PLEO|nr:hypothetical protein BDV95DRAFT_360984 [Massariosphaeria phaeospora]